MAEYTTEFPASRHQQCTEMTRSVTRDVAKDWHKEAENTRSHDTAMRASRLYLLYLNHFPGADDMGEMRALYEELQRLR